MRLPLHAIVTALALAAPSAAQQVIQNMEPNDTKEDATPAFDLAHGDRFGHYYINCGSVSGPDVYRVRTAPLVPGLWRHRLVPNFWNGPPLPAILGRSQFGGIVDPISTVALQEGDPTTTPESFLQWYGFGGAEELYVDLGVSTGCRSPAYLELETVPVQATMVAPQFVPGQFILVTVSPTSPTHDVDLILLDQDFDVLPGACSRGATTSSPSLCFGFLTEGRYYVGVGHRRVHTTDPAGQFALNNRDDVLDFRGGVAGSSAIVGESFEVAIGQAIVQGTFIEPFELQWFAFDVGIGQNVASFCPGDGSAGSCACATSAPGQGAGCANSTGRGARLWVGGDLDLSSNSVQYEIEDLPPGTSALLFAGLATQTGVPGYGGNLCLAPGAARIGSIFVADAVGRARIDASYALLLTWLFPPGTTVYAQAAYRDALSPAPCHVNLTNGESFMVRP